MAILSFGDKDTEIFFLNAKFNKNPGWKNIQKVVKRKLDMIHYAEQLADLKSPPGNKLEVLKGSLAGYYSIRANDQWRIIFRWSSNGPEDVMVVDYH